ncbi:MAG: hypothetical protein RQ760_12170 [Sedimentisphaerales bacterium]|nr:hypothetical protein [Sedimentisphaerales bacterium]
MDESSILEKKDNSFQPAEPEVTFSSNCVRLSGYELIFVIVVAAFLFCFGPWLWERVEKFEPESDFRLPYELSNDYWLYNRYCRFALSKYDALVIGDSVVWGHYVSQDSTLSHYLNQMTGRDQFANLGVDGIHPVALAGLLKYYARDITGRKIVLHFNPLWMSSSKQDLQSTKEFSFNHPKLAPQFFPKIPCYRETYSGRFSIVTQRYVPILNWASHLKVTYFENMDIPTWTLEHPFKNPAGAVTLELPTLVNDKQNEYVSWIEKGTTQKDFPWVKLETSLQWKFFRKSVELLSERGNSVFVLIGPFNEHMLKGQSIETYRLMKSEIALWLQQNNIAYYMAPALPSELYADASHPLDKGYAMIAKQLLENESFISGILNSGSD